MRMHLAGHKIRLWREAHDPPLSAEEFGARYGDTQPWPSRTVYGWEAKGKVARPKVQKRLSQLGICEPADWLEWLGGKVGACFACAYGCGRQGSRSPV